MKDGHSSQPALGYANVVVASVFILAGTLTSATLSGELASSFAISAVRCFVQLQLLSFVLRPVFASQSVVAVVATSAALFLLGAIEVCFRRQRHSVARRLFARVLGALLLVVTPCAYAASRYAMRHAPWWQPDAFIPLLGMMLGNSMSAMAIGVSHAIESVVNARETTETWIAYGGTPIEITLSLLPTSLRIALLPTINTMSIVGLVTMPGTMVGAILGGESLEQAALLQTNLLYIISGTSALSCTVALLLTYTCLFDDQGRLHIDHVAAPSPSLLKMVTAWYRRRRSRVQL